MERKEITALLIDAEPEEFMAYKDYGDKVAVVGPDGKKFVFTNEQLEAAEPKPVKKPSRATKATKSPAKPKAAPKKADK